MIEIIKVTKEYVAVNKPFGVTVHRIKHLEEAKAKKEEGDKEGERYLTDWVLENYPETRTVGDDPEFRPGIVHRLDKETSGAMLVARSQESFDYLKSLFQEGGMHKSYLALVYGEVKNDEGTIDKPIGLISGTTKRTIHGGKMVKEAFTEYKVKKRYDGYTLLEVSPKTGRTHQIRVHLASIGHPIVGDKIYGGKKEKKTGLKLDRQFLHCYQLLFVGQNGKKVKITAELPEDLTKTLEII